MKTGHLKKWIIIYDLFKLKKTVTGRQKKEDSFLPDDIHTIKKMTSPHLLDSIQHNAGSTCRPVLILYYTKDYTFHVCKTMKNFVSLV
jgi:hypothetical protein